MLITENWSILSALLREGNIKHQVNFHFRPSPPGIGAFGVRHRWRGGQISTRHWHAHCRVYSGKFSGGRTNLRKWRHNPILRGHENSQMGQNYERSYYNRLALQSIAFAQ